MKHTLTLLAALLLAPIAGLAAASAISVKKLTLKIMANSEFDFALGTVEPEAILNHQYTVEGEITLNKTDDTYRQLMLAGTYNAMDITFDRATNSKLQLPDLFTIKLPLPSIKPDNHSLNLSSDEGTLRKVSEVPTKSSRELRSLSGLLVTCSFSTISVIVTIWATNNRLII